ncbi:MAG: peptidoglycan-associated lipoprotein [Betaproteobacteria bacterium RIFCSPLOWO2_12_FULL_62_13]|nr:MAG: peptidoglycan-associated lipoprotein [Betaproteobacteria bacterium RIFCSPLOWO2_12_FULL_62_13]
MRRILMGLFIAGVVAGCASTPTEQEGAKVEDRIPSATVPEQPAIKPAAPSATAKPLVPGKVGADPLKDPGNILSKRSIYFDYDSNAIKEEYKPIVAAHAKYLSQHRSARMRVEGNADERGSREYNIALGQRRADAVREMMQLLGASASQIETVSFGEEKPKCTGHEESCWWQNRRGDIRYDSE